MGHTFSTVRWESPTGGKFRIYSRFYDVYGLGNWLPVEVQERIVGHPAFDRVGECLVMVELKPNGTHEIEFRKESQWSSKQVKFLDCALDGLSVPYHWWGLVIIRPHLRIAKEAADKIASAKVKTVITEEPVKPPPDIRVPPPPPPIAVTVPVITEEKKEEVVKKKVTISEEKKEEPQPPKKASSGGKEKEKPVEVKIVEEVVEKSTETVVEKKDEAEAVPPVTEEKKGKKKKGKN